MIADRAAADWWRDFDLAVVRFSSYTVSQEVTHSLELMYKSVKPIYMYPRQALPPIPIMRTRHDQRAA